MSLKTWWREILGEAAPRPPAILTEDEAVERVRAYAIEHNRTFQIPLSLGLKRQRRDDGHPAAGFHYVYHFALSTDRPGTFVEVDAKDGTVLAWRTLPR